MKIIKFGLEKREQMRDVVLKLRHGPSFDQRKKIVYLSYASIARALSLPYATV